jgi:hypothetical protein
MSSNTISKSEKDKSLSDSDEVGLESIFVGPSNDDRRDNRLILKKDRAELLDKVARLTDRIKKYDDNSVEDSGS